MSKPSELHVLQGSRGIDNFLSGATLDFAVTNVTVGPPDG